MRVEWLLLLGLAGCASLKPPPAKRAAAAPTKGAVSKSQMNPVAPYPDPTQPSRFRGLHFLGEGENGNPEFLTQVENVTGEKRSLRTVRLELLAERAAVRISDGTELEAPEAEIPFALRSLWQNHRDGGLWFSDGVAPGLFRYQKEGTADRRWVPRQSGLAGTDRLPESISETPIGPISGLGDSLYLFTEAPVGPKAPWARVVEWMPDLAQVRSAFFYPLDDKDSRIAGAVALTKTRFLVAEGTASTGYRLYRAETALASDISAGHWLERTTQPAYFEGISALRPAKKTLLFNLEGEGELDGLALVDYHTVAALRSKEQGAELWLQRLEGPGLTASAPVDNPVVVPEMSKSWRKPSVETL